jgi:predicted NUDIX family phosphoesterase
MNHQSESCTKLPIFVLIFVSIFVLIFVFPIFVPIFVSIFVPIFVPIFVSIFLLIFVGSGRFAKTDNDQDKDHDEDWDDKDRDKDHDKDCTSRSCLRHLPRSPDAAYTDSNLNRSKPRMPDSAVQVEQILVVPTPLFHRLGYFQGFTSDVYRYVPELLSPQHTSYRPRGQMENDPSFKQLIPYVIFRHTDHAGCFRLFQYTRGTGQGEERLHRKRSIGIGGHISSDDAGERNAYAEGMRRELAEEVSIDTPYREQCVGLINDDQTEVGRVHLGIVHLFDVEQPQVRPREAEILDAGFVPVEELVADLEGFETWSQICLQALFVSR